MTASEFAFLALGLVLGVASGSALVVVLGSRPPAREVRVTVEHDAIPRRAATLSIDAFGDASEVARGGPADRRGRDRDTPDNDPPPTAPYAPMPVPVMRPVAAGGPSLASPLSPIRAFQMRTNVPSGASVGGSIGSSGGPRATAAAIPDEPPMAPGPPPPADTLRLQADIAAGHAMQDGQPSATALLEAHALALAEAEAVAALEARAALASDVHTAGMDTDIRATGDVTETFPETIPGPDPTPAITRILRGDHRALLATVAALAGDDDAMRRPWQAGVTALAEAIVRRAINRGILDFPVGNPFWDTFTTEQCRSIAAALAATGHRFDGIDGWEDERIPTYRDLTDAVAASGLEPRRVRAWPTSDEIGALYREVTVAADEEIATESPDLDLDEVREVAGARAADLELLWTDWDRVREVLAAPVSPT